MRHLVVLLRAGVLLLACVWLTACSSAEPEITAEEAATEEATVESPDAMMEAFYQAAIKMDMDTVLEQISVRFSDSFDDNPDSALSDARLLISKGIPYLIVGNIAMAAEEFGGLERLEIVESSIAEDGQSAKMQTKLVFNNGRDMARSGTLRRVDGKWKLEVSVR